MQVLRISFFTKELISHHISFCTKLMYLYITIKLVTTPGYHFQTSGLLQALIVYLSSQHHSRSSPAILVPTILGLPAPQQIVACYCHPYYPCTPSVMALSSQHHGRLWHAILVPTILLLSALWHCPPNVMASCGLPSLSMTSS